jgi:hypothetical protein
VLDRKGILKPKSVFNDDLQFLDRADRLSVDTSIPLVAEEF